MNARKIKKMAIIIPAIALLVLLVQRNYDWIFGLMIGSAIAFSSCELIQKAVNNTFVRKGNRTAKFFLAGYFLRFVLFAALLYLAIVQFKINAVAIAVSFTIIQVFYPIYLVNSPENRNQHV
jgi:hypothetical protein